jgi:hypothetical protein
MLSLWLAIIKCKYNTNVDKVGMVDKVDRVERIYKTSNLAV